MMKNKNMIMGVVISLIVLFGIGFPYWTEAEATITVTDKERIVKRNGTSSKYLVFTESETFENTDCFVRFKFSSSDLHGSLKVGETYRVRVYGWRVPVLSMYRNIVRVVK